MSAVVESTAFASGVAIERPRYRQLREGGGGSRVKRELSALFRGLGNRRIGHVMRTCSAAILDVGDHGSRGRVRWKRGVFAPIA